MKFLARIIVAALVWATALTSAGQTTVKLSVPPPTPTPNMLAAYEDGRVQDPSAALLEEILAERKSLFPAPAPPDLNVSLRDGKIIYSTTANYYTQTPECAGQPLDFRIAATANFGLRGYVFDSTGCLVFEVGQHDTAYYSVAEDTERGLLAYSIPGQGRIDIYHRDTFEHLDSIAGYSATTVQFHAGDLYFSGFPVGGDWNRSSVFRYSINSRKVVAEFMPGELADVRGISFYRNIVAVSDGAHHRIIVADSEEFEPITVLTGLNYPNGVSFTNEGDLLVADEHNGLIHRLSQQGYIEWTSPPFELISPGSAVEISRGQHKGALLIADADGNRVIVVKPDTWEIIFEVSGVRSTLKAIPLY